MGFYDPRPVLESASMRTAAPGRRHSWLAMAGIAQAIGVALLPKCPLCLAMDFGILGTLLAAFLEHFGPFLWPSLAVAAVSGAFFVRRLRFRRDASAPNGCCSAA
ncbi:MAG TPA: hypothetical protein VMQ61_10050 [Thermoanaerobaculia bacterium]|nr:hypothetical protein [Thermoanaerobaculia bacterium]